MNIRFTSSLTPEDENLVAPALLKALSSILDLLPIAYVIRIDTTDSKVYEQGGGMGETLPIVTGFRSRAGAPSSTPQPNRADVAVAGRPRQS
jgi:hypothetical protein